MFIVVESSVQFKSSIIVSDNQGIVKDKKENDGDAEPMGKTRKVKRDKNN